MNAQEQKTDLSIFIRYLFDITYITFIVITLNCIIYHLHVNTYFLSHVKYAICNKKNIYFYISLNCLIYRKVEMREYYGHLCRFLNLKTVLDDTQLYWTQAMPIQATPLITKLLTDERKNAQGRERQ